MNRAFIGEDLNQVFIGEEIPFAGTTALPRRPVPGARNNFMADDGMSLGPESWAPYSNSLTIGRQIQSTAPNQVMIGNNTHYLSFDDAGVVIDGMDLLKEIEDLKRTVKQQQLLIEALWDAPGMPGANQRLAELEELEEFENTR